jgi:hypothetical protein
MSSSHSPSSSDLPLVSCHSALPFPPSFRLQPVLSNRTLRRLVTHRLFYPLSFLLIGAMVLLYWALLFLDGLPVWAQFAFGAILLFLALAQGIVALAQVDKRLLRALFLSFEYWWLLGNVAALVYCSFKESTSLSYNLLGDALFLTAMLNLLSLDAMVEVSRRTKTVGLSLLFVSLIFAMCITHTSAYNAHSVEVQVFFYESTTASIRGSALFSFTVFIGKYLFHVLWRPQSMLIVISRIQFQLEGREGGADAVHVNNERGLKSEHLPLDGLSSPLLLQSDAHASRDLHL